MRFSAAWVASFLAFVSSTPAIRENVTMPLERQVTDAETAPVIIVTLDGAMWQDVVGARGRSLMPNLYAALDRRGSALAEGISASGPNFVSLPGYTELFEGRTRTGCADNFCNGATYPTLADEIRAQHGSPSSVAVISSWERIAYAATLAEHSIVVSTGRTRAQGNEDVLLGGDPGLRQSYLAGRGVSAWPGHADYRPDRYTAALALEYLRAERPALMFVGLGDTDEHAHRGDRRGYEGAIRRADAFVGDLERELGEMGDRGERTLVIVTADHGRAHDFRDHGGQYPESARTWLFALGGPAAPSGFVTPPIPRHLADVAPTIREVVGLPPAPWSDGSAMTELLAVH